MNTRCNVVFIGLLIAIVSIIVRAESNESLNITLSDKDVKVFHFEDMKYPAISQYAPLESEGFVVVRANLDNGGRVLEASAISGKELLIADTLTNIKKWRFQPNNSKVAVVVYNYRLARGICKSPSSVFTLDGSNLATITACWPASAKSATTIDSQEAVNVLVDDKDMDVLNYEDLRYPPLARTADIRGVVVVQAKLDQNGGVIEASAIYGHPMLTPDCLANVKKWRFRPNAKRLAVVVYNFKFLRDGLLYNADYQLQFVLRPPNFATVTGTKMMVQ